MQVDKGFLLSVYDIVSRYQTEEKTSVRIRADIALVHIPIAMIAAKVNISQINAHKHNLRKAKCILTHSLK